MFFACVTCIFWLFERKSVFVLVLSLFREPSVSTISLSQKAAESNVINDKLTPHEKQTKILSQVFKGFDSVAAQPKNFVDPKDLNHVDYLPIPTRESAYMKAEIGNTPDDITIFSNLHTQFASTLDPSTEKCCAIIFSSG